MIAWSSVSCRFSVSNGAWIPTTNYTYICTLCRRQNWYNLFGQLNISRLFEPPVAEISNTCHCPSNLWYKFYAHTRNSNNHSYSITCYTGEITFRPAAKFKIPHLMFRHWYASATPTHQRPFVRVHNIFLCFYFAGDIGTELKKKNWIRKTKEMNGKWFKEKANIKIKRGSSAQHRQWITIWSRVASVAIVKREKTATTKKRTQNEQLNATTMAIDETRAAPAKWFNSHFIIDKQKAWRKNHKNVW